MQRSVVRAATIAVLAGSSLCAGSLRIPQQDLPWAIGGLPYDGPIAAVSNGGCPNGDVALTLAAGVLPRGVELSRTGLAGVPRELGTFPIMIRATNGCESVTRKLQLVVSARPILQVVPGELVFECKQGGALPPPQILLVASTWSTLPYSVKGNPEWLGVEISAGVTPGPKAPLTGDPVTVRIQPAKLAPGVYHATLVISAWRSLNAPAIPVTLKILPEK